MVWFTVIQTKKTQESISIHMKSLFSAFIFFIAVNALGICPDTVKNEKTEDCPWAEITREISEQKKSCTHVFKKEIPFISEQLKKDSKSAISISLWGEARNFDENAKSIIVDSSILNCLAEKLNLTQSIHQQTGFQSVHAGIQHTYAYLFSNTPTPYGYKRARWVRDDLQTGFGLSPKALTPFTTNGSFLTNVTYFFSKFAFSDDDVLIKKLEKEGQKNKSLSDELVALNPKNFQIRHLVEFPAGKPFVLHTTFVKMKDLGANSKNTHLLIYWVENIKTKSKQLITGFPVESGFVEKAFDIKNLGPGKPIVTRYNAWVTELANESMSGLREASK